MGKSHGEMPEQQRPAPDGPPAGEDADAPPGGERRYRANPDFIVRKIAGEILAVPTGATAHRLNATMILTESGGVLWEALSSKARTQADLVAALQETYDVDTATAAADVSDFLERAQECGIVFTA